MATPFASPAEPRLVHEEEGFLLVEKPAGLHSSAIRGGGPSLVDWLRERRPRLAGLPECGLLHRLDLETSGLLLVATSAESLRELSAVQEAGLLAKDYLLLVGPGGEGLAGSRPLAAPRPLPPPPGGLLVRSRFRSYGPGGARVACLAPEAEPPKGKALAPALYETRFFPAAATGSGDAASPGPPARAEGDSAPARPGFLLRARILRGFRHQIRAHAAWSGWPIHGDGLYGGAPASRLMLHAFRLEFPWPGAVRGAASVAGAPPATCTPPEAGGRFVFELPTP